MPTDGAQLGHRNSFGRRGEQSKISDKASPGRGAKNGAPARDTGETKRTAAMTLVAIGAGAFGVWAFYTGGSSSGSAHGKIYASPAKCAADGVLSRKECQLQWQQSLKLHAAKAPGYSSQVECEIKHGTNKCTQPGDVGPARRRLGFIPMMSGYVMGKLAGGGYQSAPLYKLKSDEPHKHRMTASPKPVKDRDGRYVSAFVWMSRSAGGGARPAAVIKGRSLFAANGRATGGTRKAGFGRSARTSGG